jgi:hypothetical protein
LLAESCIFESADSFREFRHEDWCELDRVRDDETLVTAFFTVSKSGSFSSRVSRLARLLSECFRIFEINIRSSYKMIMKPSDIDMTVVDSVQLLYAVKSLRTVCRIMDDSGSRDIRSKVSVCQKKEFFFCDNRCELKSRSIVDSVTRICCCPEGRFRKTHAGRLRGSVAPFVSRSAVTCASAPMRNLGRGSKTLYVNLYYRV